MALIVDIPMPKACYKKDYYDQEFCPFQFFDYDGIAHCSLSEVKCATTRRPKDCPLVEVNLDSFTRVIVTSGDGTVIGYKDVSARDILRIRSNTEGTKTP